jgi:hypothetical protein
MGYRVFFECGGFTTAAEVPESVAQIQQYGFSHKKPAKNYVIDGPSKKCYNTFLNGAQMQEMYKLQIDKAMLALQTLIDQQFEENESIQNAFNALACALDEELYE